VSELGTAAVDVANAATAAAAAAAPVTPPILFT